MPSQIELVKELHTESSNWHAQFPWFSLGQLINTADKKQVADFQRAKQTAAIFFNDIQRLHWLLQEETFNKNKILEDLQVPITTEGMQATLQPFPVKEHPQEITEPDQQIAVAAVNETDAVEETAKADWKNNFVIVDDISVHHIHTEAFDNTNIPDELQAPISTEVMQATPQPFPVKEYLQEIAAPEQQIAPEIFENTNIPDELQASISTEVMQATPQPFPVKEYLQEVSAPDQQIAVAAVNETDTVEETAKTVVENDFVIADNITVHHTEDTSVTVEAQYEKALPAETVGYEDDKLEIRAEPEQVSIHVQQPEKEWEAEPVLEITEEVISDIKETRTNLDEKKEALTEEDITGDVAKNEKIEDEAISIAKAKENIMAIVDAGKELGLVFEPYHTVDYFASQGIKVDGKTDDRLGQQLKSFTSWLKSMKRLPSPEDAMRNAPSVEISDKSLENTNVITEAMAAVLLKQGKKELAIEIFKELSLLHPEKSRYFAAQIEQIKI